MRLAKGPANPEEQGGDVMSVHRFLVTGSISQRMATWEATGLYANWIEGRGPQEHETWLVTCMGEHGEYFLAAARATGVTLQEVEGAGDTETYPYLIGAPGSGWETPS